MRELIRRAAVLSALLAVVVGPAWAAEGRSGDERDGAGPLKTAEALIEEGRRIVERQTDESLLGLGQVGLAPSSVEPPPPVEMVSPRDDALRDRIEGLEDQVDDLERDIEDLEDEIDDL